MGIELKSIGVNIDWAPVTDIHSNPDNPVIGKRAFSTDAERVAECALRFVKSMQAQGVLGCAKHFPGHGHAGVDSHHELPVIDITEADLRARELIPFKCLIENQIPLVMTAHVSFPKIDTLYPGTLSETILRTILRDELGFEGVVVTDALEMRAIYEIFQKPFTVGHALNAGCDLFIVSRFPDVDSDLGVQLGKRIYDSILEKKTNEKCLHQSFLRIEKLFQQLPDNRCAQLDKQILAEHEHLAKSCA